MAPAPLDRFMADPDVRERFEIAVRAPAAVVMQVAKGFDMQSVPAVRAIFRLRAAHVLPLQAVAVPGRRPSVRSALARNDSQGDLAGECIPTRS